MGIVTNFVGCDCLRKSEEINTTDPDSNNRPKIVKNIQEDTLQDKLSLPYNAKSELIKNPIPEYFDGKIDAKDYIQKGDSLENYQKIKRIGKGSYGSVFKVMNKNTNLIRAMKVMPKNFQKDTREILREIEILKHLDHPNFMKIY